MGSCIARPGAFAPLATARKGHGVDMYVLAELSLTTTISIAVAAFLVGGVGGVVLIRMMTGGTIRAAKRDAEKKADLNHPPGITLRGNECALVIERQEVAPASRCGRGHTSAE